MMTRPRDPGKRLAPAKTVSWRFLSRYFLARPVRTAGRSGEPEYSSFRPELAASFRISLGFNNPGV